MLSFIKNALAKAYTKLSSQLHALFSAPLDEESLRKLEHLLLEADVGVTTTKYIMSRIKQEWASGHISDGQGLHHALRTELITILGQPYNDQKTDVYLLVGINGSGKTTLAGKLAHRLATQAHKKIALVAADTFRAAATEQLAHWATRVGAGFIKGAEQQDPSAVVFQACQAYNQGQYNTLIIDTAGRLQTKTNLIKELEKIRRVISKQLPHAQVTTLVTIDAMLGQNSKEQARVFHEATKVDGVVLTKVDGTGKGGIIFGIRHELGIPIAYLSCGEQSEQLTTCEPNDFVATMLQSPFSST